MTTSDPARELDIVRTATRLLRKATAVEGPQRARLLRQVADLLVDLRALHTDGSGNPDWSGKSFAYRDAVRDIYAAAGLPHEGSDATKTALRYHVGVALRERLSEDDLVQAGLSLLDPRDRQAKRREDLNESTKPTAEHLISSILMLVRRLDDIEDAALSAYDLDRALQAARRLTLWAEFQAAQNGPTSS